MSYETFEDAGIITRRYRGNEKVLCPRCSGDRKKSREPSLSVDHDKKVWHCHHCDWSDRLYSASTFKDYSQREHKDYAPAKQVMPISHETELWQNTVDWFAKRGISEKTVLENNISVSEQWMPQFNEKVPVIVFPYTRDGEIVNHKYRGKEKSFMMDAGAERIWYGLDTCGGEEEYVVLVEGELDKLALWEAGIRSVLSVPDGAPSAEVREVSSKFDFYASGKDIIKRAKTVIVATDKDDPGYRLAYELARRVGLSHCRRVHWPMGCKDANDVLAILGPERLRECIFNSRPWPVEGVVDPASLLDNIWSMRTTPIYQGIDTGWNNLSALYKPAVGQLTTIGGTPGSGKSVFMNALFVNIARIYGWTFGIYSPEYFPVELHVRDLMSSYIGKSLKDMTLDDAERANAWVAEHFRIIYADESSTPDLDWIINVADSLVEYDGIKGMLIDPFTEVEAYRDPKLSQTEYINKALTQYRKWCRMKGVHGWVNVHPTKLTANADGSAPVVTPYDLAGSAHWYNKSDNILSIHRDKQDDNQPIQVHVQKVRFADEGGLGIAYLNFDKYTKRYTEAG